MISRRGATSISAETFNHINPKVLLSLSDQVIKEFEKDSVSYSRV